MPTLTYFFPRPTTTQGESKGLRFKAFSRVVPETIRDVRPPRIKTIKAVIQVIPRP